ncbi:MAG TPA: GNAT family N-acetyltransferase [Acidimicrobiales bacterium]|nr:GNAT family N-acetyltransferase [Acidimicrobiales bacterium]
MEPTVRRVGPQATWALRQAVLRPHQSVEQVGLADEGGELVAFAAVDPASEEVVSTATLRREAPPFDATAFPDAPAWRLRGMATREDRRRAGIGGRVLSAAIEHVATSGGGLLWCNARLPAHALYERAGLVMIGEAWDEPDIGPHVVMWRLVAPSS